MRHGSSRQEAAEQGRGPNSFRQAKVESYLEMTLFYTHFISVVSLFQVKKKKSPEDR